MNDELELVRMLGRDDDLDDSVIERVRGTWRTFTSRLDAGAFPNRSSMRSIVPYLIYDDVERALRWLSDAFGFRELRDARFLDDLGVVQHAELDLFGARVMMGPPSIHGESPRHGVSAMLDVSVPDVDEHYDRARAAGATIVIDLQDTPWGSRRYQASDVEGHQWQFSQSTVAD